MSLKIQILKARKILVASVGVATASFVGIGCGGTSVANLPAPPSCDVAPDNPYCVGRDGGGDGAAGAGPGGAAGGAGGIAGTGGAGSK